MEWIILIWLTANPVSGFHKEVLPQEKLWQVFTTTTPAGFDAKWNSLSVNEKTSALIFKGREFGVTAKLSAKGHPPQDCDYPPHYDCGARMERLSLNRWRCSITQAVFGIPDDTEYINGLSVEKARADWCP